MFDQDVFDETDHARRDETGLTCAQQLVLPKQVSVWQ